jgi:TolB-like protein
MAVSIAMLYASVALAQQPLKPSVPVEKPPRALPTLLVFDLVAEKGVEAGHMSTLTEIVIDKVSKTKKYQVVGQKDLDKMLFWEQNKQLKGCTDTACLVQIAGAMGAQFYIEGSVGGLASNYYITLKLIEASNVKVLERSTEKVGRDEQALARGIEKVINVVLGIKIEEPPATAAPVAVAKVASGPLGAFDKKFWGQVGVYSGIGFVVLGSVSWAIAKKAGDDFKAAGSQSAMDDLASQNDTYNALKLTGFIAGGLLAATGGVLWYMGANERAGVALNVTPVLTPNAAALQVGGAW